MGLSTKQLSYTAEEIDILLGRIESGTNMRKGKGVLVYAGTSNIINYKNADAIADPFSDGVQAGIPAVRVYDSDGNPIYGYTIFDADRFGFKITVSDDGLLDYLTVEVSEGLPT